MVRSDLRLHIVEDDAAVREALALVLEGEGYAVDSWADGERFLGQARIAPDDLLLLDLGLPGMSGAEVAKALRARGDRPRTIVLSGMRGIAFDQAVRVVAPAAALRKPLTPGMLGDALRAVCA